MQIVCDRDNGLFPHPIDIKLDCNCPDWASLCKHLAAVLYGVGARLDESPELLFLLRGVDHEEMISAELAFDTRANTGSELTGDLSDIFGVDIDIEFSPALESTLTKKKKAAAKITAKSKASKVTRRRNATAKKKTSLIRVTAKKVVKKRTVKKRLISKQASPSRRGGSGISIARGLRASHLKKLRSRYQLSVADLSSLSGISAATIHRWEKQTGVVKTNSKTQLSIQRVFELNEAQLTCISHKATD